MNKKLINWLNEPIWIYTHFDNIKVGDKVRTCVGFSHLIQTGIVSSKYSDYVWIDVFFNDKYIRSFTASKSYCTFGVLKKRFRILI